MKLTERKNSEESKVRHCFSFWSFFERAYASKTEKNRRYTLKFYFFEMPQSVRKKILLTVQKSFLKMFEFWIFHRAEFYRYVLTQNANLKNTQFVYNGAISFQN